MADHLIEGDIAVQPAKRKGKTGTRRGERLEPQRGQHPRRPSIPGIGDDKRLTRVQGGKRRPLLLLSPRHRHAAYLRAAAGLKGMPIDHPVRCATGLRVWWASPRPASRVGNMRPVDYLDVN